MDVIRIERADDPRVAAFRDIRERDLTGREGRFIAEGEVVVRLLTSPASRAAPEALLLAENRVDKLADVIAALPKGVPTYMAPQDVLDGIAGFALHRGILALGRKPAPIALDTALDALPERARVLVLCGIGNHDNMGGLFRNAAAFGTDLVVLDPQCCDPFYRKAIRVSVGAVLRTPMAFGGAEAVIDALQARGFEAFAMTPSAALTLRDAPRPARVAVLMGSEGPGLPRAVIDGCTAVGVPMAPGFDSLNVGTAAALALHHFA